MLGQPRGSFQTPPFVPPMPLVAGFSHRQMSLPLPLGVGGKRPVETRLRGLA
jgi:hypothetical protein